MGTKEIRKLSTRLNFTDKVKTAVVFFVAYLLIIGIYCINLVFIKHVNLAMSFNKFIASIFCFFLIMATVLMYVLSTRKKLALNIKMLCAFVISITFSYLLSLFLLNISPFLVPMALTAFLVAPLSERRDAFVGNLICNILVLFTLLSEGFFGAHIEVAAVILLFLSGLFTGTMVAYTVSNDTNRMHYIIKGFLIGLIAIVIYFMGLLFSPDFGQVSKFMSVERALPMILIANIFQIFLGLTMQPILETMFNLVTNSRLMELTDHNSPLVRKLMIDAPGTFNHCLAVANFAEVCAIAIGENPYLARACAYYHDVGKLVNPLYFKENQSDYNPHDEILPEVSAEIIRNHTNDGYTLCKKYRIPFEISQVALQHHGRLPIMMFYNKAKLLTDSQVDKNLYSYKNDIPQTKIAAIIMISDSGEAAIRAMDKPDGERVDKLLRGLISDRIASGAFDECDITLKDLTIIRRTMINAFGGLFHKRIKYTSGDN